LAHLQKGTFRYRQFMGRSPWKYFIFISETHRS